MKPIGCLNTSTGKGPLHDIVVRLAKVNDKETILRAARQKQKITYKGTPIRLSADFSTETLQARRDWNDIFKMLKDKKLSAKNTLSRKNILQI